MSVALVAQIAVVAAATAPSGAALPACTKTWTSPVSGSWDVGASWSGGTVPTPTDHVCIGGDGFVTVTLADGGAEVTVASLTLGGPTVAGTQTLLVTRGVQTDATSLTATQGIDITQTGALVLGDSALAQVSVGVGDGATIVNDGAIAQQTGQLDAHYIRGDVVNTGNFRLDAPIFVEGDFTTDGMLQDNHVLHVAGTMWTKGGAISGEWAIAAHGGLRVGDAVIGNPSARPVFSLDDGELAFESEQPIEVTVYDDVTVAGDTASGQNIGAQTQDDRDTTLTFTGTWTNRGFLDLQPGAVGDVSVVGSGAGATLVNEGELVRFDDEGMSAVVDADVVNRGLVETSDGKIIVLGGLENEATIDIGRGGLSIAGDLLLDPSSAVVLVAGHDAMAGSRLASTASATVDGTVTTQTEVPQPAGSATTLVTASDVDGTFDEIVFEGSASYQVEYSPGQVLLRRRASESATRRFVRAAFQDFLDRQPDAKELSNIAGTIDGGGGTRASLVRSLSQSPAYVTSLVQRFYLDTLGRPGDPDGVAFWVGQLRSGRLTVAEVAGSFYASGEYFTRAGGTNQAWIGDLYDVFFERPPTEGDLDYWIPRIAPRGRSRVAIELFQSLESRRQRVQRLYADLLGRRGDSAGVDYWAGRVTAEGDLALAVFLASSSEYLARAQQRYP